MKEACNLTESKTTPPPAPKDHTPQPPQPPNRINGTESRKTPHTWSGTHAAKQMQACNAAGEGIR